MKFTDSGLILPDAPEPVYTKELAQKIHEVKPPHRLVVDITKNPDYKGYLGIRVYENQVMAMSNQQQNDVLAYLHRVRVLIESWGFKCFFDGVAGDPPRGTYV